MDIDIKAIDESNLEDEVRPCIPSLDHPKYSKWKFEKGVKDKVEWLRQRLNDYGYVGHIAYNGCGQPLGFVEFISAKNTPFPIEKDVETTAIITCINLSKVPHGHGIGTRLLKTTLRHLWKIGVCQVKTLVSKSPRWIHDGIYRKYGFQLERTFYKEGNPEPFDLLTLRLNNPQPKIESSSEYLRPPLKDTLPIEVICFRSAQCPFNSPVYNNHKEAMRKFTRQSVKFKTVDAWKNPEMAKRYGSMHFFDTFINGRSPFFGPPSQEEIENEIHKEINRITKLT